MAEYPNIFGVFLKYIVALLAASTQWFTQSISSSADLPRPELADTASPDSLASNTTYIHSIWYPTPDYGAPVAEQQWVHETFGNSWGKDVVKSYAPPDHAFNKVKLHIQFDTFGRQYDRLAHLYLDGVEIWRPSTPEPGNKTVSGHFTKDVSNLLPLFQKPSNITFQLYNIVDKQLTGTFETTITAEFFLDENKQSQKEVGWYSNKPPTDVKAIGPLLANVPSDEQLTIDQLPRNTTRAIVQVFASGNADEEFWYASSLDDSQDGPTRLVEAWINGQLAGYASPFPVIYTGGWQPHLWSPLVGLHAYDVPNYFIDVTPFLPELWDGESSIRVHVSNGLNSAQPRHEWLVNLALLTWQEEGVVGTGTRLPQVFKRSPSVVRVPSVQVVKTKTTLITQAELEFNSKKVLVQWNQVSRQSNVQVEKKNHLDLVFHSKGTDWFHYAPVGEETGHNWTRHFDYSLVGVDSPESIRLINEETVNVTTPVGKFDSNAVDNASWGGGENRTIAYVQAKGDDFEFSHRVIAENHTIVADEYDVDLDAATLDATLEISELLSFDLAEFQRWLTDLDLPGQDSFDDGTSIDTFSTDGFVGCKPVRVHLD